MIVTWKALRAYTGFHSDTINRFIRLYGFPAPRLFDSRNRKDGVYWDKATVDQWFIDNAEYVAKIAKECERRHGFGQTKGEIQ